MSGKIFISRAGLGRGPALIHFTGKQIQKGLNKTYSKEKIRQMWNKSDRPKEFMLIKVKDRYII